MADVKANELTAETAATLAGTEQFVMFDAAEGKRCTVNDMIAYQRAKKGCMEHKTIRCNGITTGDKSGFPFKQEATWANMTENDNVIGVISSGDYPGVCGVESASGKVVLHFVTSPGTSVYVTVYREVSTNV